MNEYVVVHLSQSRMDFHMMFYDPKSSNETEQLLRKEYYWRLLNTTGVSPWVTFQNTSTYVQIQFYAEANDRIAFHSTTQMSYKTNLQTPIYDVIIECPANTGNIIRHKTLVDYSTSPFARWRFSEDPLFSWEEIVEKSMSLRPPFPSPVNESVQIYHEVSPQDLRMLENACARDLFVFYLIVQRRQDHDIMRWGPVTQVYFTFPVRSDETGPDWIEMTQAFCLSYPEDCANIQSLTLTNAHLLAVSNRGIFVSIPLSAAPVTPFPYKDLPLVSFYLIDPCSKLQDLFYCYTELGQNPLIHSVELHYTPVCHISQAPNYRDIVVLIISHDALGESPFLRNQVAWTVLYAEQPYIEWALLVRAAVTFDKNQIHNLKAVYYNHQLNHFDFVAQVGPEKYPVEAYLPESRWYIRFILPAPTKLMTPNYYEILSTELGEGFLPKVFPNDFEFNKLEVSVGSLDIHFIGNQVWISELGSHFVYLSASHTPDMEYCNFNQPDRIFICVATDRSNLFVGKISAFYRAHEIHVDGFPELRAIAADEGWFIAPSSRFDSGVKSFINPRYRSLEGRVFAYLARPIVQKALKGVFYRVSAQGSIQIWYMEGSMKNEQDLVPLEPKVNLLEDAIGIVIAAGKNPEDQNQTFNDANEEVKKRLAVFRNLYEKKLSAKQKTPMRLALLSIPSTTRLSFERNIEKPALCPFFVDGITVALYEAKMDMDLGFQRTDVGNTIRCMKTLTDGNTVETCNIYIRHIKFISDDWLLGFRSVAYAYILQSIPMHAFSCLTQVHVNPWSNDAFIYIRKEKNTNSTDETDTRCREWKKEKPFHYIGWTFYIPGHFSVLITMPEEFTLPDQRPPLDREMYADDILFGKATATFEKGFQADLSRYEGMLINMASKQYQEFKIPHPANDITPENERFPSLPSFATHPGECLFELKLLPNSVLKSSGGIISLDLHDSFSFGVEITSILQQGEVIMQQIQLKLTNSNTKILSIRRKSNRHLTSQGYDITAKPTGFGIGQATLVIRTLSCLPSCLTPCSLTFIFQVMRAEGRRLIIHYPIQIPVRDILNPESDGNIYRNSSVVYKRLPVNYRPPSTQGIDIPLSGNIYNADPSKPLYRTWYKVSQVSGSFKQCDGKKAREECGCSPADKIQEHPSFTDCKEMVYLVRRATEFLMRVTYPPIMEPALQHQGFYLEKPNLLVWITEVNGRQDYSLTTNQTLYLNSVNSNQQLHRGKRFYDANDLTFTVYGTGIYHFRAALGEFDSFDDVSGYFTVFSEDYGLDDLSFMLIFFATLMGCFLLMFCGFLNVRKRIMRNIPKKQIVDQVKLSKMD